MNHFCSSFLHISHFPAVFFQHKSKHGLPFTVHGQNCTTAITGIQPLCPLTEKGTFSILPWGVTAMESSQLPPLPSCQLLSEQDGPQTPVTSSRLCLGQGDS